MVRIKIVLKIELIHVKDSLITVLGNLKGRSCPNPIQSKFILTPLINNPGKIDNCGGFSKY